MNKRTADYLKARDALKIAPRVSKHQGSKRGYVQRGTTQVKGNAWRAMTRSLRRYPGWKKRMVKLVASRTEKQPEVKTRSTDRASHS